MTGRKPSPETSGHENPAFYRGLGRAIKVARTRLGLERKDLAIRADLSYAYLSDIETGRGRPSSSALLAIAKALGMDASSLLSEAEAFMKPKPEVRSRYFRPDERESQAWVMASPQLMLNDLAPKGPPSQIEQIGAELHRLTPSDLAIVLELTKRLAASQPEQPNE